MVAIVLTGVAVVLAFQWWRNRRARPNIVVEIDADKVRITMGGALAGRTVRQQRKRQPTDTGFIRTDKFDESKIVFRPMLAFSAS